MGKSFQQKQETATHIELQAEKKGQEVGYYKPNVYLPPHS